MFSKMKFFIKLFSESKYCFMFFLCIFLFQSTKFGILAVSITNIDRISINAARGGTNCGTGLNIKK